jgi:hypothetical protein
MNIIVATFEWGALYYVWCFEILCGTIDVSMGLCRPILYNIQHIMRNDKKVKPSLSLTN